MDMSKFKKFVDFYEIYELVANGEETISGIRDDHGEEIEDFEVIYGGVMHLEMLKYYPETRKNAEAVRYMKELQNLIPNLRVEGQMPCISDDIEKAPARHRQHR